MNTVDALNVLGKALCGDSFEVKPGLTDAETILEIAKNYTGGSGSGGGSFTPRIIDMFSPIEGGDTSGSLEYEAGLGSEDFIGVLLKYAIPSDPSNPTDTSSIVPILLQNIGIVDLGESIALIFADLAHSGLGSMSLMYNPETGHIEID